VEYQPDPVRVRGELPRLNVTVAVKKSKPFFSSYLLFHFMGYLAGQDYNIPTPLREGTLDAPMQGWLMYDKDAFRETGEYWLPYKKVACTSVQYQRISVLHPKKDKITS
jgi:hypothetical protein